MYLYTYVYVQAIEKSFNNGNVAKQKLMIIKVESMQYNVHWYNHTLNM